MATTVNYAQKYAQNVDERFSLEALTTPAVNNDYDFDGVNTVNVYSIPAATMGNYTLQGTSRYGTPGELSNSVQTLTLSRDRSFTFTIDRRNYSDTMMTMEAGRALARQMDEAVIPEIDQYRLEKIAAATTPVVGAVTKTNAYEVFLDGTAALTEAKVPLHGRVAFITPTFFKLIKLDGTFIKSGDLSQQMLPKGQIGTVDNVPLILTPASYLPENTAFLLTHPAATVSPVKLAEYRVHENPPGISGWLVEGRFYYDAFVLNNKKSAIYLHTTAAATSD